MSIIKNKLPIILLILFIISLSNNNIFSQTDSTFIEIKKLLASDADSSDWFGDAASISGDYAIVGARYDNEAATKAGAAYIFNINQGGSDNWGEVVKLSASDAEAEDRFGASVSISGDYAIVGAVFEADSGYRAGAAYIFYRNQGGADNWGQVTKIIGSDTENEDWFGVSVSISGDYVVVGAYNEDTGGSNAGAAYIYYRNQGGADNWGQVTKISSSDIEAGDSFGFSVSISGDYVVVGAYNEDAGGSNAGAAYIFNRNQGGADNWGQVTKIVASDPEPSDNFGISVSISGNDVIVGARNEDAGGSNAGAAYIFNRNQGGADNWGEVTKLVASDALASVQFGRFVSISNSYAVAGAQGESSNGSFSGAAYVFNRNQGGADNWGETKKLVASDSEASDYFGSAVAISGDYIILGAYKEDEGNTDAGAAYIFKNTELNYPNITTVDPDTGDIIGGTEVTITGTDFGVSEGTVLFGEVSATGISSWSNTEIVCFTPAGSVGSVDVIVETSEGYIDTLVNGYQYSQIDTTSYVLDDLEDQPSFAISLRKISNNATFCVKLRRSSDNAEQDFGFVNGYLDTTSVLSWVGASDAFITTWYDQSGDNLNAIQMTVSQQPQLVMGGSLIYENNKPVVYFNGSNILTVNGYVLELSQNNATAFAVAKQSSGNSLYLLSEGDVISPYSSNYILGFNGRALWVNSTLFGNYSNNTQQLFGFTYDGTNFQAYNNGAVSGAAGTATVNIEAGNLTAIGGWGNGSYPVFNGYLWEIIGFKEYLTTEKTELDYNITEFYQILDASPSFTSVPDDETIYVNSLYQFQYTGTSPIGAALTFAIESGSVGDMAITSNGLFTFTPLDANSGSHEVIVSLTDGNETLYDTTNITVLTLDQNYYSGVTETGEEYTVFIDSLSFLSGTLESGDEIGIFDLAANGGIGLVGNGVYDGSGNINIKVQMEAEYDTASVIAGAKEGNPIIFKFYDKSADVEYNTAAIIKKGGNFGDNPLTYVNVLVIGDNLASSVTTIESNILTRLSLPVVPFNGSIGNIFPVSLPDYMESDSELFYPEEGLDTLTLEIMKVYKTYSEDSLLVSIAGTIIDIDSTIALNTGRVNYIPYPYHETHTALQLFGSTPEISYADNGQGDVYIPGLGLNSMNIYPTNAIKVYTTSNINYTYPQFASTEMMKNSPIAEYEYITDENFKFKKTGEMYPIVITKVTDKGGLLEDETLIGIFDGERCVGTGRYDKDKEVFALISWMEVAQFDIAGARNDNPITLKIADTEINIETIFKSGGTFGKGSYSEAEITVKDAIPDTYMLSQNYPNPFNPTTTISYALPEASQVRLKIYNILGEQVTELVNEMKEAGNYEVEFNGTELSSGVYFYSIQAGDFNIVKKMMLLK